MNLRQECKDQVEVFPEATFKKFKTYEEARSYLRVQSIWAYCNVDIVLTENDQE